MPRLGMSARMVFARDAGMLRFGARFTAIADYYGVSVVIAVAGIVRIPITLRIRIPTIVVRIRIGISVAAVVAIVTVTTVTVRVVRITWTTAKTTCGKCCGQDPAQQHYNFSRFNRFHTVPSGPHSEPLRPFDLGWSSRTWSKASGKGHCRAGSKLVSAHLRFQQFKYISIILEKSNRLH